MKAGKTKELSKARISELVELLLIYSLIFNPWTKFPITIPLVVFIILTMYWLRFKSLESIGFRTNVSVARILKSAVVLFICIEIVMDVVVQPLISKIFNDTADYSAFRILAGNTAKYSRYLLFIWLSAAIGEEILFRGYISDKLEKLIPESFQKKTSIVLSSAILFAIPHWSQGIPGVVVTFIFGVLFGFIYQRTGKNIWITIVLHGLIDSLFITLGYFDKLWWYTWVNDQFIGY